MSISFGVAITRIDSVTKGLKVGIAAGLITIPMGFSPSREIRYGWMACLIGTAAMDAVVILENSITGQPLDTSFVLFGSCAQSTLCKSKL